MKKLYLILTLLFAFALLTCDDDKTKDDPPPPPPPPTLDQRLIGGKWYFPQGLGGSVYWGKTSDGYYKFTEDSKLIYSSETTYYKNISDSLSGNIVYSKDGIVYLKDTNRPVMKYDFPSTFPYPNNTTDFYLTSSERSSLNALASKGDLITYRIYNGGSLYEDSRISQNWFLARFKDDGTQYRDYD